MEMIEIEFKTAVASSQNDESILYSNKILTALKEKVKEHNSISDNKVYLSQLKDLFISGAKDNYGSFTTNESGWARINMYLRMVKEISSMAHAAFEESKRTTKTVLDFSCLLQPIEQDFVEALADTQRFGVTFDFGDISNLYLSESEQVSAYYQKFL